MKRVWIMALAGLFAVSVASASTLPESLASKVMTDDQMQDVRGGVITIGGAVYTYPIGPLTLEVSMPGVQITQLTDILSDLPTLIELIQGGWSIPPIVKPIPFSLTLK